MMVDLRSSFSACREVCILVRVRRFLVTWLENVVGYKLSRVALGTRMGYIWRELTVTREELAEMLGCFI